jgi:hypothetical protein
VRSESRGSDPNVARIAETFGAHDLAANLVALLFYASIYYLSLLDPLFCFSTGHREKVVGFRGHNANALSVSVRKEKSQTLGVPGTLYRIITDGTGE